MKVMVVIVAFICCLVSSLGETTPDTLHINNEYVAVYQYWELEHTNMEKIVLLVESKNDTKESFGIRYQDAKRKKLIGVFRTDLENCILCDKECYAAIDKQLTKDDGFIVGFSWSVEYNGYVFSVRSHDSDMSIRYIYRPDHQKESTNSLYVLDDNWFFVAMHKA